MSILFYCRDLSRISEVDQASAANAECMQLYLECQLCLAKVGSCLMIENAIYIVGHVLI